MNALPTEFVASLRKLLPDQWHALADALAGTEATVSVRVNERRGASVPVGAQRVPWSPSGFYCDHRPQFTFDPLWHSGLYYVQDASSMFIAHVLHTLCGTEPLRALDLCAAPGGKSTAALDALPAGSLLVANDVVPARARVLRDNVVRWGNPAAIVACDTPAALGRLAGAFDVLLADVPCSGEGMMRKDAEAVAQWTPALVEECAARQRTILADAWPALRPGGLLVYSTCTFNRLENEAQVEHLVDHYGAEPVAIHAIDSWGIAPAIDTHLPACRFMPHHTRGEGLFVAALRKPGDAPAAEPRRPRDTRSEAIPPQAGQWLRRPGDFALSAAGGTVSAMPRQWQSFATAVQATVNVLHSGVTLGTAKGKKFLPDHALALTTALDRDAVAAVEVDYDTAMAYLRGLTLAIDAPPGPVLITYRDAPLGWVNNLGTRANNLYPKPLRILSQHTPDTDPNVLDR